jgi:hypothetical protein
VLALRVEHKREAMHQMLEEEEDRRARRMLALLKCSSSSMCSSPITSSSKSKGGRHLFPRKHRSPTGRLLQRDPPHRGVRP